MALVATAVKNFLRHMPHGGVSGRYGRAER